MYFSSILGFALSLQVSFLKQYLDSWPPVVCLHCSPGWLSCNVGAMYCSGRPRAEAETSTKNFTQDHSWFTPDCADKSLKIELLRWINHCSLHKYGFILNHGRNFTSARGCWFCEKKSESCNGDWPKPPLPWWPEDQPSQSRPGATKIPLLAPPLPLHSGLWEMIMIHWVIEVILIDS